MNSFSKLCNYRLLGRHLLLQQRQTRTIFTESWVEPEKVQRKRQEFLDSCGDVKDYFNTIQHNYKTRGIEALSQNQINNLIGVYRIHVSNILINIFLCIWLVFRSTQNLNCLIQYVTHSILKSFG